MSLPKASKKVKSNPSAALIESAPITRNPDTDTGYAACKWISGMAKANYLTEDKVQSTTTCLTSLMAVMSEDEPKNVRHLLAILDELGKRWILKLANENKATNPKSEQTYKGRAKWLLQHYIDFCESPNFDNKKLLAKERKTAKPRLSLVEPPPAEALAAPPGPSPLAEMMGSVFPPFPKPQPAQNQIVCPLLGGTAVIQLPFEAKSLTPAVIGLLVSQLVEHVEDFSVRGAGLIASYLAARAHDFDPTKPTSEQLFARPAISEKIREAGEQAKQAAGA